MTRPETVTDELFAYLSAVGNEYKPHRHRTIVLHMIKRFAVSEDDAETAIRYWLGMRSEGHTVN